MTDLEYYQHPAMSNSKLKWFNKSPLHFKHFLQHGEEVTKAQEFGSALALAVLKPILFTDKYFMLPNEDKRTLFGKIAYSKNAAENRGKIGLSSTVYENLLGAQKAIFDHHQASQLIIGEYNRPMFWTDSETLIRCKARPQIYDRNRRMVAIKTTLCADPANFNYQILKYGYHRQAAFNLDAAKQNIPYYIIAVEKQAPYAVSVIKLSDDLIEKGRQEYKLLLRHYSICLMNDSWPGYEIKSNPDFAAIDSLRLLQSA